MKNIVKKIVLRLFPELDQRTHLPMLARVISIADPPKNGETYTFNRPRYAVDVRILTPDLTTDAEMPLLRDVPVAICGAGSDRGISALPQPGTIVELGFAFGRQNLPFVRSALPYGLNLVATDGRSMRWALTPDCYQNCSSNGDWIRRATGDITDIADGKITLAATGTLENSAAAITRRSNTSTTDSSTVMHSILAPKIMLGNGDLVAVLSAFMGAVITALDTLASHTHPQVAKPDQKDSVKDCVEAAEAAKAGNDAMMP